jgi:hypothetical protein
MRTPVALIIFNRPDKTQRVFSEISKSKPPKLFIIADGPRDGNKDDIKKCEAARKIVERVDWDCKVYKNYSNINMGCGKRPPTGISWVFQNVDEAIILEDDCIPNSSFFKFCEALLEKYREDERIMTICGRNETYGLAKTSYSYSFRRMFSVWGWASWRRAWKHYDIEIKLWQELRDTSWLMDILGDIRGVEFWQTIFDKYYCNKNNDTWDYQWAFAIWAQNGFAIMPEVNLVNNIGFGDGATHTRAVNNPAANIDSGEISFPLRHPPYIARELDAELIHFDLFHKKEKKQFLKGLVKRFDRKYLHGNLAKFKRAIQNRAVSS